jgi:hypothetical protein
MLDEQDELCARAVSERLRSLAEKS